MKKILAYQQSKRHQRNPWISIRHLIKKVNSLTGGLLILNAELAISKHVSTMLSEKIDDQEQYSSRSCLVFEGLNNMDEDNKNLSQEIVNIVRYQLNVKISGNDIDKSHSIKKN